MEIVERLLPYTISTLSMQSSVGWIYVALFLCLAIRLYILFYGLTYSRAMRSKYLTRTASFSEAVTNAPVVLGVIGTVIGVATAAGGRSDALDPAAFAEVFGQSFSTAVTTTIAGGMIYIICFLITGVEDWLAYGGSD